MKIHTSIYSFKQTHTQIHGRARSRPSDHAGSHLLAATVCVWSGTHTSSLLHPICRHSCAFCLASAQERGSSALGAHTAQSPSRGSAQCGKGAFTPLPLKEEALFIGELGSFEDNGFPLYKAFMTLPLDYKWPISKIPLSTWILTWIVLGSK